MGTYVQKDCELLRCTFLGFFNELKFYCAFVRILLLFLCAVCHSDFLNCSIHVFVMRDGLNHIRFLF